MAVQNIWIYADSLGMGGYWSTGAPAVEALTRIVDLQDGEKVLGLLFLGRHDHIPRTRPSKSVDQFTTWMVRQKWARWQNSRWFWYTKLRTRRSRSDFRMKLRIALWSQGRLLSTVSIRLP